jgi:hypothetical protein
MIKQGDTMIMAEHKTLQGILALVDIVNFTGQANQLGEQYTAQYCEYFQEKIKTISERHGFNIVKSMGDAVLFFGAAPEGILDIMTDLFLTDKPGNKYGFISRFRMVAHSGFFQFETKGDEVIDLVSPEGIKVFRMEKFAQFWELVVTQNLYQGIKPLLTQKNIEAVRMVLNEPLKGFDSEEKRFGVRQIFYPRSQRIAPAAGQRFYNMEKGMAVRKVYCREFGRLTDRYLMITFSPRTF